MSRPFARPRTPAKVRWRRVLRGIIFSALVGQRRSGQEALIRLVSLEAKAWLSVRSSFQGFERLSVGKMGAPGYGPVGL